VRQIGASLRDAGKFAVICFLPGGASLWDAGNINLYEDSEKK